jgi:hypothetical protein
VRHEATVARLQENRFVESALESGFASWLADLERVLLVEALSAESLGFAMLRMLTPRLQQLK